MGSSQDLHAAILALYNGSSSQEQRSAASRWLNAYAATDGAWQGALELAAPGASSEVRFFAANLLLSKVRQGWGCLAPEARAHLAAAISERQAAAAEGSQAAPELVLQRLCLALGAVAALDGPPAVNAIVSRGLAQARVVPHAGLDLLAALAEEGDALGPSRRSAALTALAWRAPEVLSLAASLAPEPGEKRREGALLRCVGAWLRLNPSGSGGGLLSPGELQRSQPGLLAALMGWLGVGGASAQAAAADALVTVLGPGRDGRVAEGLRRIACVAAAIAERAPEVVSAAEPEGAELAGAMLRCVAELALDAADGALDFFAALAAVPLAERVPALREPMAQGLAHALLASIAFPQGFVRWEDAEIDEDAFHRFREQAAAEALGSAYAVLRADYLDLCGAALQGAASWQAAEAALTALRLVAAEVQARVLRPGRAGAVAAQDAARCGAFLATLFAHACGDGGYALVGNAWLATAAARLAGDYAAWLGGPGADSLEGALRLTLAVAALPGAAGPAAAAFRALCVRGAARLQAPAVLAALTGVAQGVLSPHGAAAAEEGAREAVVEGLSRVIASMPEAESGAASAAALDLTRPPLQRLQQLLAGGQPPSAGELAAAAAELRLLAAALRFLEFACAGAARPPAVHVLEAAFPMLEAAAAAPAWIGDAAVVAAMCETYQRTLLAGKAAAGPLLPSAVDALVSAWEAARPPAAAEALGTAVEVFGADAARQPLLATALERFCGAAAPADLGGALAGGPEGAAALLALLDRCLLLARGALAASNALPRALAWALDAARARELEPARAGLALLSHALSVAAGPLAAQVEGALAVGGAGTMAAALLRAAADTCPRQLLRPAAASLRVADGFLSAEDCHAFCAAALADPLLPNSRFAALLADFASIPRGEGTSDMLLAHQM
ncbi:hypothetical protein WJX81_001608 [Elliptochloris bilobata]|uniref:Importin N-terminal domain-containing protein n=1 Tax=Elliptochloris bilobata TaxID=381761 RepID=A0AAW1S4W8_9CHLO